MPFGFHLTMDTLHAGEMQAVASGPPWLLFGSRFRALLDFSAPSTFSGPRGIGDAFGYSPVIRAARGTVPSRSKALLSAQLRLGDWRITCDDDPQANTTLLLFLRLPSVRQGR